MPEPSTTIEVPMDNRTKRFYQGAATANKVIEAHADVDFPDDETRVKLFYFYAGVVAVDEHDCRDTDDFEPFMQGLATRAPHIRSETDHEEDGQ